jgi:hypothetical protein
MHFCPHIPIILVGCKKDLRKDQKVIEELRRKDTRPISPAVVSIAFSFVFAATFSCLAFLFVFFTLTPFRAGPHNCQTHRRKGIPRMFRLDWRRRS